MNAEMILTTIKSLNTTIESLNTTKSELETLLTLHLMEAQKIIPFLVHDLHERMHKLKTANEHPNDFPSIISTYSGHLSDFYRQLVTLERLAVTAKAFVKEDINIFKEFYSKMKS